jgi:hypothetical protein
MQEASPCGHVWWYTMKIGEDDIDDGSSVIRAAGGGPRRGGGGGDGGELLEVELDDGVGEHARVLLRVPLGDVDDVGLDDDAVGPRLELGDGGDGAVVAEAVVAADDAEAQDVAVVVEDLEALGAGGGREARDDGDLADAADGGAVAGLQVAGLDEVLVALRAGEAPHDGPHSGERRVHALRHQRRARPWRPPRERVVRAHHALQLPLLRLRQALPQRALHVSLHACLLLLAAGLLLLLLSLPVTRVYYSVKSLSLSLSVGLGAVPVWNQTKGALLFGF